MRFLFFFFLFPLLALAANPAQECQKNGKIRFTYQGKKIEEAASYCYDSTRSSLQSLNCKEGSCAAVKKTKQKVSMQKLMGQFGTPGFKLCYEYKGQPQIMEFFDGKKWWSLDRCIFTEDNSFLDTGSLIAKMRDS